MDIKVDISELDDLQRYFQELSSVDQRRVMVASYKRITQPLVDALHINVPKRNLNLYRSIKAVGVPQENAIYVGSSFVPYLIHRRGKTSLSKVWYGWLLDQGSFKTGERHRRQKHIIKRGISKGQTHGVSGGTGSTGTLKATHWFTDAWNATRETLYNNIGDELFNSIKKFRVRKG